MEWISVEDCSPPKSEKERLIWGPKIGYLIATFVGRECAGYLKELDNHGKGYRWYPDGIPGVTHWMSLPDPPEQETITIIVNVGTGEKKAMTVDEFEERVRNAVRQAIRP